MIKGAKKEEVDYTGIFLNGLTYTIEKLNQDNKHMPSATFSPSSMKCDRQMIYKLLSVPIDDKKDSYQLVGICENGTARHECIQSYQMCRKTPAFRHGDIRYNKGKHIEKLVCRHN